MTWKCVPHKMFLWISLLDTFQTKNPSDATLASLSILKYSKIQNGRQMAENIEKNQHNTCMLIKKLTSLVVLTVFFWFIRPCQFENCIMNCLKISKIKMASKMVGINKKTASQSCIQCFVCSFYVLINKNTII